MKVQDRIRLFVKRDGFQPEAYHVCPVFDRCSCNLCPLDSKIILRTYNELDPQRKCKCPKRIRKEIGTHFNLSNQGLTSREISGAKRWDSMTSEAQEAKKLELRQNSPFARLKQKGYGIVRVGKPDIQFTLANEPKTPIKASQEPFSDTNKLPAINEQHKEKIPEKGGDF